MRAYRYNRAMTTSPIPIIDLAEQPTIIQGNLARACQIHGFFYVKNHSIEQGVVNDLFDFAKKFFSLPEKEKNTIHFSKGNYRRGYVPLKAENTDTSMAGD